jgi:hypothetical protein
MSLIMNCLDPQGWIRASTYPGPFLRSLGLNSQAACSAGTSLDIGCDGNFPQFDGARQLGDIHARARRSGLSSGAIEGLISEVLEVRVLPIVSGTIADTEGCIDWAPTHYRVSGGALQSSEFDWILPNSHARIVSCHLKNYGPSSCLGDEAWCQSNRCVLWAVVQHHSHSVPKFDLSGAPFMAQLPRRLAGAGIAGGKVAAYGGFVAAVARLHCPD